LVIIGVPIAGSNAGATPANRNMGRFCQMFDGVRTILPTETLDNPGYMAGWAQGRRLDYGRCGWTGIATLLCSSP
jgi:hypothetical protein